MAGLRSTRGGSCSDSSEQHRSRPRTMLADVAPGA
jgi:hypothetical protein